MRVRFWLNVCGIAAILGGAAAAYLLRPFDVEARDLSGLVGDPNRGAYLARASGCFSCHTNGAKGGAVLAGGGPLKTPFGTFYAPNITTDRENGIGAWTVEQFSAALTRGVSPRGENYYPAFVYPNYTLLGDQDIVDLWAAFKTVPPVPEAAPAHELSFPFDRRVLINAWKRLFFAPGRYAPDPSKSEQWNRGRFLVTGPGHCGACHTPRNLFGAPDDARFLEGTAKGAHQEKVPPITGDALRKSGWASSTLVFSLRTGSKPDGDVFGGGMGHVVRDGTRWLSDADLNAIAEYLMSVQDGA